MKFGTDKITWELRRNTTGSVKKAVPEREKQQWILIKGSPCNNMYSKAQQTPSTCTSVLTRHDVLPHHQCRTPFRPMLLDGGDANYGIKCVYKEPSKAEIDQGRTGAAIL
jgi:hypothetical protein